MQPCIACSLVIAALITNCASAQTVREATPTFIDFGLLPAAGPVDETADVLSELSLADVVASLYRSYPEIARVRANSRIASGQYTEAYGAYDLKGKAYSLSEPTGFYENYRHGIGAARQTWWGGEVSAGYRIGRGVYAPWYLERETNKGGEFKVAATQPLLRGKAIDVERLAVFSASLARAAAQPQVRQAVLDASLEASTLYWEWVAAGATLTAQQELLDLAEKRGGQFATGVKAGKFAEIDLLLNDQLIAERRAKRLESEQKFRAATIKLSIFMRDGTGQPMLVPEAWLPKAFPVIEPEETQSVDSDILLALSRRPVTELLRFESRQLNLEQQLARNQLLPQLDLLAEASQDTGEPTSSKRDKSEFEIVVGFQAEMPVQRRKAFGKLQSIRAKQSQVNRKIQLQQNKIEIEVRTYRNAIELSEKVVVQNARSFEASLDVLQRYRFAFERGKIDLIYLNLLESKTNEIEIKMVEAQRNWFINVARLQRALALDPMEAAIKTSSLPKSERPGPGNLPEMKPIEEKVLADDWKRHEAAGE